MKIATIKPDNAICLSDTSETVDFLLVIVFAVLNFVPFQYKGICVMVFYLLYQLVLDD